MASKPVFHMPFQPEDGNLATSNQQHEGPDAYLDVPPPPDRRPSHASTFSEISDIAYMSNRHSRGPLARTISNASNFSVYSNAGALSFRQRLSNFYYQNYGAMLVLIAQVFGTGMNVTARLLEQPGSHGAPMHPFQILLVRQTLTALLCTAYALWTKSIPYFPLGPPDRKVRLLLVSRGLFGFFGVFGMYFSLLYLPLSEATVLTFLSPILTCYLCTFLLPGESFTRQQQIAGFVSFIGVIFIARPISLFASASSPPGPNGIDGDLVPLNTTTTASNLSSHNPIQPTNSQHLLAIGIAMLGVCGATGAMISIRAIGTRAHAFISVNYFCVWSAVVSLIAILTLPDVGFRIPGTLVEWALLLNLGMCGFVLQILLTMGLSYGGPASNVSPEPKANAPTSLPTAETYRLGNKAPETFTEDIELQASSSSSPYPPRSSGPLPSPRLSTAHRPRSKSQPKPSGNRATSMVYCQMLYALAADKLVFGTILGAWSWLGSLLILGGAIWVATAQDGRKPQASESEPARVNTDLGQGLRLERVESAHDGQGMFVDVGVSGSRRRPRNFDSADTAVAAWASVRQEEQVGLLSQRGNSRIEDENEEAVTGTERSSSLSSSSSSCSSSSPPSSPVRV